MDLIDFDETNGTRHGAFLPYVERYSKRLRNIVLISTFHQKPSIYILIATVALIVISLHHFIAAAPVSPELALLLIVVCTFLAVFIGFFVAAASGYMAGLVGSSSSPISGIGIISVIVISLVLVSIGNASGLFETADGQKFLTALTLFTASIVLTTATISNDNLQDLKPVIGGS